MSLLTTPFWQNLNGDPLMGVSPPSLLVLSGRLTPQRHGEIRRIYMQFSMAKLTAVGDYFVFNRVLSDGTRVRIESMQGRDRVFVWASDVQSEDSSWDRGWSFIPANDNSLGGFLRRPGPLPMTCLLQRSYRQFLPRQQARRCIRSWTLKRANGTCAQTVKVVRACGGAVRKCLY